MFEGCDLLVHLCMSWLIYYPCPVQSSGWLGQISNGAQKVLNWFFYIEAFLFLSLSSNNSEFLKWQWYAQFSIKFFFPSSLSFKDLLILNTDTETTRALKVSWQGNSSEKEIQILNQTVIRLLLLIDSAMHYPRFVFNCTMRQPGAIFSFNLENQWVCKGPS